MELLLLCLSSVNVGVKISTFVFTIFDTFTFTMEEHSAHKWFNTGFYCVQMPLYENSRHGKSLYTQKKKKDDRNKCKWTKTTTDGKRINGEHVRWFAHTYTMYTHSSGQRAHAVCFSVINCGQCNRWSVTFLNMHTNSFVFVLVFPVMVGTHTHTHSKKQKKGFSHSCCSAQFRPKWKTHAQMN